jgi:hypothetical protein
MGGGSEARRAHARIDEMARQEHTTHAAHIERIDKLVERIERLSVRLRAVERLVVEHELQVEVSELVVGRCNNGHVTNSLPCSKCTYNEKRRNDRKEAKR